MQKLNSTKSSSIDMKKWNTEFVYTLLSSIKQEYVMKLWKQELGSGNGQCVPGRFRPSFEK